MSQQRKSGGFTQTTLDLDSFLKNLNAKTQDQPKFILKPEEQKSENKTPLSKPKDVISIDSPEERKEDPKKDLLPIHQTAKTTDEKRPIQPPVRNMHRIFPGCKFCDIIHNQKNKIIFEDDTCVAFFDKKQDTSQEHILLCSKSHIKNCHCVTKEEIPLLTHLQDAGEALLKKRRPNDTYRFGYHEPPMNSIEHLHLHCFVLPIKSNYLDKVIYGFKLASTEKIISKILSGEIIPGVYPEKVKKHK